MKPIALKVDSFHVVLRALAAGRIFAAIQPARHPQAFRRRRLGNELDHGFIVTQGFAAPIRRNKGKEAMFDLVPFACPGRKMADRQGQADLIRQGLQFQLPRAQPPTVAAPSSAVMRILAASGYSRRPSWRHQPRIEATANAPVSWSVPTLTNPVLRPTS